MILMCLLKRRTTRALLMWSRVLVSGKVGASARLAESVFAEAYLVVMGEKEDQTLIVCNISFRDR